MLAVVLNDPSTGAIRVTSDAPLPKRRDGEALIRIRMAGICSTDLELARGYMDFRGTPGHEFVGDVVEGPPALTGKRVVGEINCPCNECDLCRRGLPTHCRRRTVLGILNHAGAFAEFITLPAANCHIVPPSIADEHAVFVEPLAAAIHVLDAVSIGSDSRVALVGLGRLGNLIAQVVAATRCDFVAVGRSPRSLALCEQLGIKSASINAVQATMDYDVVIEATGSADGLQTALGLVRPRGTVVLKSTYATPPTLDLAPLVIHEITIVGNRCGRFAPAIEMLARSDMHLEPMIDARFPLMQAPAAFSRAAQPGAFKILLIPDGSPCAS
ncbi:MAG: alcohol dehydrogenase catalytic domain-containing protein [Phycisphaerales bacterium]|nr:alcohol dehydrogenase catalytic domain-containing protein [Phycisphaerales bacterium]